MGGVNSRRAWLVVSIGTIAYIVGVFQRSSLGVAGVAATERYDLQAALLSTLAVVQIVVYAVLQVPVGVLVDRWGPRVLVAGGAIAMAFGQVALALGPSVGWAILGRVLVGVGDAMTFISVQRLVVSWFSGRRVPVMTQFVGSAGQVGQILSAVPFAILLGAAGWVPAFLSAASLSVLAAVLVIVIVTDAPRGSARREPVTVSASLHLLREALARPGTQLGFWSHFVTQSSGTMFVLLWGVPFMSIGIGLGARTAALLLTVFVGTAFVCGPLIGLVAARYPFRRSTVVLGIVALMAVVWTAVLAWPGVPPVWLIVMLIVAIGIGGPASLIGLDFARTFNPARSLGSANGFVNAGGFVASFIMMLLIGVVLDVVDTASGGTGRPEELYSLAGFRVAFLVQYVVVGAGVVLLILARRRTRARLQAEEGITVAPLWVGLIRTWRRER